MARVYDFSLIWLVTVDTEMHYDQSDAWDLRPRLEEAGHSLTEGKCAVLVLPRKDGQVNFHHTVSTITIRNLKSIED